MQNAAPIPPVVLPVARTVPVAPEDSHGRAARAGIAASLVASSVAVLWASFGIDLGGLPVILLAVSLSHEPIVDTWVNMGGMRGVQRSANFGVGALVLVPALSVSSMVAGWARYAKADRFVRVGAWASQVVVALGAGVGLLRIGRPDADTYVASLPIVRTLTEGGSLWLRDGTVTSWRPGTLADAKDELAGRATTLYALAMTSGLLCASPLLLSGLGGSR